MEFNYGHLLEVGPSGELNRFRFQNFYMPASTGRGASIRKSSISHSTYNSRDAALVSFGETPLQTAPTGLFTFLPFNFGGAVATLLGDNLDATLQFGNSRIARNFVVEALDNNYVARVRTVLWTTAASPPYAAGVARVEREMYEYFGACSAGGWDEAKLQVKLNSVLDAVQTNVPGRRLRRQQVGNIPFTAQVRV